MRQGGARHGVQIKNYADKIKTCLVQTVERLSYLIVIAPLFAPQSADETNKTEANGIKPARNELCFSRGAGWHIYIYLFGLTDRCSNMLEAKRVQDRSPRGACFLCRPSSSPSTCYRVQQHSRRAAKKKDGSVTWAYRERKEQERNT